MTETQLRDIGQYAVRNQLAGVPGASVPPPFGGKYRQIMVYVDPAKLQSYEMSPMDVVRAVNNANLILPSGDVKIGPFDYNLFTNSQFRAIPDINQIPLKTDRPLDRHGRRRRPRRGRAPDPDQRRAWSTASRRSTCR